VYEDLV